MMLARPVSMKEASGTAVVEQRTRPGEMVLLLISPKYLAVVQLLFLSSCSGEAEQWRSELFLSTIDYHLQLLSSVDF